MRSSRIFYAPLGLALVVAAAACSSQTSAAGGEGPGASDGGTSGGEAGTSGGDGSAPVVRSTHFSDAGRTWTVPLTTRSYLYFNLDGDGHVDAVRTEQDGVQTFGTTDADAHYEALFNDGQAFPSTSAVFSVPYLTFAKLTAYGIVQNDFDGDRARDYFDRPKGQFRRGARTGFGAAQPWDVASLPPNDGTSIVRYADLDGDKRLDAIITGPQGRALVEGSTVFINVARGTGAGFGPIERFVVPVDDPSKPVDDAEAMDWNGDGKADLVSALGKDGWRVWIGTGTGFAPEAKFALPTACYCNPITSGGAYSLLDIDGDGRLDLVEPADWKSLDDKTSFFLQVWGLASNKPFWKVYLNDGKTFAAAPLEWHVPVRGDAAEGYNGVSDTHPIAGLPNAWFSMDWDGDGRVDLVDLGADLSHTITVFPGVP